MTDQLDLDDETVAPADTTDAGRSDADRPDAPSPTAAGTTNDEGEPHEPSRTRRFRRRQRVSKWDRPPEPHDWRFWVGNVGKVLIATGVLLFLFVAYQLWGTGIETARAQNRLTGEFEQLLAEFADDADDAVAAVERPTEIDDVPDRPATERDRPAPVESAADPRDADEGYGIIVGAVTEATPIAYDLSDEAVAQDPLPLPDRGDPLFRLEIPAIGRDDIVVAGVALDNLKDGPGHYPDTPLPGQLGNAAIAGHRTTYGAPFFDVDRLGVGDELITTLPNGDRFVYEVTFVEVVRASDSQVIRTSDPSISQLTLTSCHPKYTARDRIIVHSVLNPAKSSNVGLPTFYELEPDDSGPIPGDDPVLVAEEIDPDAIDVSEPNLLDSSEPIEITDADSVLADDADEADDEPVEPAGAAGVADDGDDPGAPTAAGAPAPSATSSPDDAFSRGWFDDDGAWLHIALWGLLLTAISLLAYQVSKRTRHDSVGFLVGIGPFMFALYFFFQNVHRLLPPGI